ncbi:DNA-binding protein, partial [Bacillus thuringiensis serovar aizawai str. Hu4-2]
MNKTELTKVVAEKAVLTQKDAAAATQAVLDTITSALANEEKVQILGFGTFEVREDLHVQDVTHKQVKKCK